MKEIQRTPLPLDLTTPVDRCRAVPLVVYRPGAVPRVVRVVVVVGLRVCPGVPYLNDDLEVVGGLSTKDVSVVLYTQRVQLV